MTHDLDMRMDWCRRCGRPYFEIVEGDMAECDGLPGVVHQRFLKAEEEMKKVFEMEFLPTRLVEEQRGCPSRYEGRFQFETEGKQT
jgi:ribosomal protein L37E